MTQVQMVTMGSYEDTVKLAQQYGQLAQQLGQTTSTVAEGADVWLRQGKTAQETTQLLTASTTLATVGQLDAATATTDLTAVMNSYGIEVDNVMGIVDQLTAIDLNYAASTGQIATALQRTAATAQQTGVSLEKLEAILAVTEQNTQLSAETIGTAWQSVFSRMSKVTAGVELDDLTDEVSGLTYSVNDADKVLQKYGISMTDSQGQMRDLGDVT